MAFMVTAESEIVSDEPKIMLETRAGYIHAELTVGADVAAARPLMANEGMSCNGMMLAGQGFVLKHRTSTLFAARSRLASLIRPFYDGGNWYVERELASSSTLSVLTQTS